MRTILAAALAALLVQPLWAIDKPTSGVSAAKPRLVILNFPSDFDGGDLGQKAAYNLRAKLRRLSLFAMPDELDFDDMESQGAARPDDAAAAERLAAAFKPRFLVWGEVSKTGDAFAITVKGADVEGEQPEVTLRKTPTDLRAFALACGELADELAEALAGAGAGYREVFPSKSTQGYVRVSENLLDNGDFERGGETPDNWERPDGLCSFWETGGEHGRHVRFDTDVYLSQWQEWRKMFEAGRPATAAPKKRATAGNKYDTVGGTYGVHLYSDAIAVKPGATYSIEFDARGPTAADFFFAKVFIKGYGKEGPTAEYYNTYKAARTEKDNRWQHFSRIFHPTERTPQVACMRVMLFAYWPPGECAFDDVEIFEVKRADTSDETRRETDEPAR